LLLRLTGTVGRLAELTPWLPKLSAAGVTELILDVDWEVEQGIGRALPELRAAANAMEVGNA
jgi:hypothetical protein